MKVYKLTMLDNEFGACLTWHPSKKDAINARIRAKRDGQDFVSIKEIEFNPTKYGVLNLLTIWTPEHDNG